MSNRPRKPGVFFADRQLKGELICFTFPVTDVRFSDTPLDQFAVRDSEAAAREQRKRDWANPVKRAAYLADDAAQLRRSRGGTYERGRQRRSDLIKARARMLGRTRR